MERQPIAKEIKRFVRLNLSVDRWNTQFSFQVVLILLLAASWNASTIHAKASTPDADTVYLRFQYQKLEEMEQEFYRQNKAALKNLRWNRRRKLFLVADETHDSYTGKKRNKWIHKYKPVKGCTGSFEFLTIALVAPGQWRKVIRCIPIPVKSDKTKLLVETAKEIRASVRYNAFLLDRGFYDKKLAFALQKANIPFLIRAEIRGRIKRKLKGIKHYKRLLHWQERGEKPLNLLLGWKKFRNKRYAWGFLTNISSLSWSQCCYWYKQRWNIENIFKATDGIQFKIATAKIKSRLFAVLLSFLVYNAWQECKALQVTTLSIFVENLINRELVVYNKTGPPIMLHFPGWLTGEKH